HQLPQRLHRAKVVQVDRGRTWRLHGEPAARARAFRKSRSRIRRARVLRVRSSMRTPQTLIDYIRHGSEQHPERASLHGWREGHWVTWSAADHWFDARDAARGLMALGLEPGERVAIVGKNQP